MMRHRFLKSIVGSSLLVLGLSVQAQDRAPRYDPYDNRSNFQDFQNGQSLFRQVRSDLDRAENYAYSGDRYWFDRVRGELSELQRQWDENEYTPRQVDKVIAALQRVVSENQLSFRDRDRLMDDLSRMRDFVATHG
ncbi:MAG TPA: hypothetical protein VNX70_01375 [Bryobacteraceae bacterium]|nr:hypothetical protein [Bryobacteraceae bacterium]